MKTTRILTRMLLGLGLVLLAGPGRAALTPHTVWYSGSVCSDCHDLLCSTPGVIPDWMLHVPQNIDDTPYNTLCWSCHNDVVAPFAKTHSSLTTSEKYGDADDDGEPGWSLECVRCHDPHAQRQYQSFGADTYIAQGTSTAVDADSLTLRELATRADRTGLSAAAIMEIVKT